MLGKTTFGVGIILTLMTLQPVAASCSRTKIINAIGQDSIYRFGPDTKLSCIGTISAGMRTYLIAYYDWDESDKEAKARGGFPHAAHGLLVLESTSHKLSYLGFYGVDSAPLGISGKKICFAHHWEGGEITFRNDGPPAKVLIDGEPLSFGR